MPVITLPDGSKRSFEQHVTVAGVAASIGAGLAKAALAGRVDGKQRTHPEEASDEPKRSAEER